MYCLYRHIRPDKNEVFYIGIGNIKRPDSKKDRNKHWQSIVKLNPDYKIEILFENLSWEEACEKEKEFIQIYGRKDLGLGTLVNLTNGGEGNVGWIPSVETKQKISNNKERGLKISKMLTGKKLSENHRQSISKTLTGRQSAQLGFKRNEIAKENISKSHCKFLYTAFKYPSMEFVGDFRSTVEAADTLNITNNISKIILGKLKQIEGYTFIRIPNG